MALASASKLTTVFLHFSSSSHLNRVAQHVIKNLKLAFIVDIVYEETEKGRSKRIQLNLSSESSCGFMNSTNTDPSLSCSPLRTSFGIQLF